MALFIDCRVVGSNCSTSSYMADRPKALAELSRLLSTTRLEGLTPSVTKFPNCFFVLLETLSTNVPPLKKFLDHPI